LIEVSIVLGCVGLLISLVLPLLQTWRAHLTVHQTISREEKIFYALGAFLQTHKRLPCPAHSHGHLRGVERPRCQTPDTFEGLVPFHTLGLDDSASQSGSGARFRYTVHPELTLTQDMAGYCSPRIGKLPDVWGQEALTLFDPIAVSLKSPLGKVSFKANYTVKGGDVVHRGAEAFDPRAGGNRLRTRRETRKNLAGFYGRLFCPPPPANVPAV
jgi:hypothetical protein